MNTKRRNDDTDAWTQADWSREFDTAERQTKAREHTALSYTDRLRDQAIGPALEPGDSWDAMEYTRWGLEHPDQAKDWLTATDLVATLDKQTAEARRTLGDEEIARRVKTMQLRAAEEFAALKAWRAEWKAARAKGTTGSDLPPHPLHNKAAWLKWQEAQRVLRFRHFNTGYLNR